MLDSKVLFHAGGLAGSECLLTPVCVDDFGKVGVGARAGASVVVSGQGGRKKRKKVSLENNRMWAMYYDRYVGG
jgi:hypothetical protein